MPAVSAMRTRCSSVLIAYNLPYVNSVRYAERPGLRRLTAYTVASFVPAPPPASTEPSFGLRPPAIPGWWWTWTELDVWRASFYRLG